ncbi:OmpH family outer membrane protein [Maritimibacter alkaliphilus]|uniref:OmpH family outer membrane protein n=1 Tax=Maritimibacter alkaliphilus TaxID=404236 RepID=UPI001C95E191|nr:OmpH family outer membrane protein [Maritimibacter alkaliphilus]MBY6089479.1 OmpH family outer membrane protein [Maritimibacter alkaliphilus]
MPVFPTLRTLRPGRSFARAVAFGLAFWAVPAVMPAVTPAVAQDAGHLRSPVLTIDSQRLFTDSKLGQQMADRVEQESAALNAENRKIEAELIAEEQALTDRRPTMEPKAFRDLADAFDEKVRRIRSEQDTKARALGQTNEAARREFLTRARPALEQLMKEIGAAVILEQRSVFLSAGVIDVTDEAISLLDKQMPEVPAETPAETAPRAPDAAPQTAPQTAPEKTPAAPGSPAAPDGTVQQP